MESFTSALTGWIDHLLRTFSALDVFCVLAAFVAIRVCRHAGMWIYALVALPGTFAHELAHFVVALILGAKPTFPSLVPVRTEHGWRLGSVAFRAGHLRALPIAIAPLALFPLALWWADAFMHSAPPALYWLHVWIVAALLTASLPSKADLKLAWPALIVLLALAVALIIWLQR